MWAPPPWPHAPAMTDTLVMYRRPVVTNLHPRPGDRPCSVRVHGEVTLLHGTRGVDATGPWEWDHDVVAGPFVGGAFDHRVEIDDSEACTIFVSAEALQQRIRWTLAEAPATHEYDLAAENWAEDFLPDSLSATLDYDADGGGNPWFDLDIEIPELCVRLMYSESKAQLLARKEADAMAPEIDVAGVQLATGSRKRRREPGELCAACLLELEARDDEAICRLPCSHAFHNRCVAAWLHTDLQGASTCPNCDYDIMDVGN